MCRLGESLSEVAKELSAIKSGDSGASKQPLAALPKGPRTLPTVKSWRTWVNTKLASWCGLQSEGFADAVQLVLFDPELNTSLVQGNPAYNKANKALAFELCGLADEDVCLYFPDDRTDGIAMLAALARAVLASSAAHVSALNDKFTEPEPVTDKSKLQHALKVWRSEYEELRAVGSTPSRQAQLRSLKRLICKIKPLQVGMEMVSFASPNDPDAIFAMAEQKAGEWAATATPDPGTPPASVLVGAAQTGDGRGGNPDDTKGKGKDAWIPCSFYLSGFCQYGKSCRFAHNNNFAGPPTPGSSSSTPWNQQTQALPSNVCRKCGQTGHWGNECPNKGKGKGKDNKGKGYGAEYNNSWIGTSTPGGTTGAHAPAGYPPPQPGFNDRKRSRIGAGQLGPECDESWIGTNQASPGHFSGGGSGPHAPPPAIAPEITLESLTSLAHQYMDQQKSNYKDTKELLQKLSGQLLRVPVPSSTLGDHVASHEGLRMIADTGAERHILCGPDFVFAINRRLLDQPLVLETANGETMVRECADAFCGGVWLVSCLLCETATSSLLATILLTDEGWDYVQRRHGASLIDPAGKRFQLDREENLYFLGASTPVMSEEQEQDEEQEGGGGGGSAAHRRDPPRRSVDSCAAESRPAGRRVVDTSAKPARPGGDGDSCAAVSRPAETSPSQLPFVGPGPVTPGIGAGSTYLTYVGHRAADLAATPARPGGDGDSSALSHLLVVGPTPITANASEEHEQDKDQEGGCEGGRVASHHVPPRLFSDRSIRIGVARISSSTKAALACAPTEPMASKRATPTGGIRMLESTSRAMLLDNAAYYGDTANKCDTERPLQRARQDTLLDYQAQQLWKAERLKERLQADARAKLTWMPAWASGWLLNTNTPGRGPSTTRDRSPR